MVLNAHICRCLLVNRPTTTRDARTALPIVATHTAHCNTLPQVTFCGYRVLHWCVRVPASPSPDSQVASRLD